MEIRGVARLARLELTAEEEARFEAQLGRILEYVEQLKSIDVAGIEPMAHATPRANVARPDVDVPSMPHEQAMQNAPARSGGLFEVPRIVE